MNHHFPKIFHVFKFKMALKMAILFIGGNPEENYRPPKGEKATAHHLATSGLNLGQVESDVNILKHVVNVRQSYPEKT